MNDDELRAKLSYASKLTDWHMLLAAHNRLLVSRTLPAANGNVGQAHNSRVSFSVNLDITSGNLPTAQKGLLAGFKDAGGNILWSQTVFAKNADVAAQPTSPFIYQPILVDLTQIGPAIFGQPFLVTDFTLSLIVVTEVIMAGYTPRPASRGR